MKFRVQRSRLVPDAWKIRPAGVVPEPEARPDRCRPGELVSLLLRRQVSSTKPADGGLFILEHVRADNIVCAAAHPRSGGRGVLPGIVVYVGQHVPIRRNLDTHTSALVHFGRDTDGASRQPDPLIDADQPEAFAVGARPDDVEPLAVVRNRQLGAVVEAQQPDVRTAGVRVRDDVAQRFLRDPVQDRAPRRRPWTRNRLPH